MTASNAGAPAHTQFSPNPDQSTVTHLRMTVRSYTRISPTSARIHVSCGGVAFPIVITSPFIKNIVIDEHMIAEYPKGANPLSNQPTAIYPASMKPAPKEEKPMTEIIVAGDGQAVTMTSIELVDFINGQRKNGEPELLHKNFIAKVPQVLGEETSAKFLADLPDSYGRPRKGYRFPKREACLMAMSYSYELQAAVFDRMTALEAKIAQPQPAALSRMEILQLAMESEQARIKAETERDEAIRTKALIGSKREAQAMATASKAVREANKLREELGRNQNHATIIAVEQVTGMKFPRNAYVGLRRWCKTNGVSPATVMDERYGMVKAWPAGAWLDQYDIDLGLLFRSAAAGGASDSRTERGA